MYNETSIKALIQKLMPKPNDVIVGYVYSIDPLEVHVMHDDKLKLNRNTLIIPKRIAEESLQVGEYLHILVFNNRKKYYALDKAVM